jgi:hypothetical protein
MMHALDSAQAAGVKVNHAKPESQSAPKNVTPVKDDYRLEDTPGYADFKLKADAKYAAYEKKLDDKVDQWMANNIGKPVLTMWSMAGGPVTGSLVRGGMIAGGGGALVSNGTAFAAAGTVSLGSERIKNASFGLKNSTGGDVSAIAFGGLGGTSFQFVKFANRTLSSAVNGGISGFLGNATEQTINMRTGEQSGGYKLNDLAANTFIGKVVGGIVPDVKVSGLNSGRNNWTAIYNANNTRINNGGIDEMRIKIPLRAGSVQGGQEVSGTVTNASLQGVYSKLTEETPPK